VLSRGKIVLAALDVIDADGLSAVSLRSVARRLSVDATSLYNHVASKDDLLDAVTEHILSTFEVPPRTGSFEDDLRAVARAFRRHALRHPNATILVLARPTVSPASLVPLETTLALLVSAGCSYEDAVQLLRMFMAMLGGSVLRDASLAALDGDALKGLVRRSAALRDSGLTHVITAAPHLLAFDSDAEFEFSLRLAIAAIATQLPRTSKPPRKENRS
jgi:AcrR family transcriptional regulator